MDIFKLPPGMSYPSKIKWNIPGWGDDMDEDEEIAMGRRMIIKVAPTPELETKMNRLFDDAKSLIDRAISPDDEQIDAALSSLEASFPGVCTGYSEFYKREAVSRALNAARKTVTDS